MNSKNCYYEYAKNNIVFPNGHVENYMSVPETHTCGADSLDG